MNKKRVFLLGCLFCLKSFLLFANDYNSMANITVDLNDEIYSILRIAQTKGYCYALSSNKPYSESYILRTLDEILSNLDKLDSTSYSVKVEKQIIEQQKKRFIHTIDGVDFKNLQISTSNKSEKFPISFFATDYLETFTSGGAYNDNSLNSVGYDIFDYGLLYGKITNYISYKTKVFMGLTKMPLSQLGSDYVIGQWWDTNYKVDTTGDLSRTINTYKNYSVFPYSYKKPWLGSIFYLSNINANGLEGWPFVNSFAYGMDGEIHSSLFDDKLQLGIGRYSRDFASMDTKSSLVLNEMAQPFFGMDVHLQLTDFISFDEIFGFLEPPNQSYINSNAWYYWSDENNNGKIDEDEKYTDHGRTDFFFFQNLFVTKSINFDFKYFHFDFGSSVVFPKRFELGYAFPLIDCVVYQDSLGDFDNLSLFTNIKGILPNKGYLWFSAYLDELNKFNTNIFEKTRCMFSYQAGIKSYIPFLPFGNVSFRYSKIEPYCYTHNIVCYNPYSNHPIAESYTNNGYSLGYYMPPNSDEFLFDFNFKPSQYSYLGLYYQLTRHGTDWGSGSVPGSNLYSELTLGTRENLRKYFLYDGTYEWISTICLYGSYNFYHLNIPIRFNFSLGYVFDWFTAVENNGQKNATYYKIDTTEYKNYHGFIGSIGISISKK